MKTNLTVAQIEARQKLYHAVTKGQGIALLPHETKELWDSIVTTGVEIVDLREKLREIHKMAKEMSER